jgi:hypothetical protein
VVLLPKELPKTHPNQVATIIVADTGEVAGTPISVRLTKEIRDDNLVVRLPDGTTLPTHTEKAKGNRRIVHFVLPPTKSLWQVSMFEKSFFMRGKKRSISPLPRPTT